MRIVYMPRTEKDLLGWSKKADERRKESHESKFMMHEMVEEVGEA